MIPYTFVIIELTSYATKMSCCLDLRTVVTGDGHTKMLMMINRQHPGPSIVVYAGQEVKLRLLYT